MAAKLGTPTARIAAPSASASPERRQDTAPHWTTVPQQGNGGYPIPANRPAGCRKRIVNSGDAMLWKQLAPIQKCSAQDNRECSGKCLAPERCPPAVPIRREPTNAVGRSDPPEGGLQMEQLFAGVSSTVGLSLHAAITGHAVNVLVRGSDVQGPTRFPVRAECEFIRCKLALQC